MKKALFLLTLLGLGAGRMVAGPPCASMNGDNNADGGIDLSDAVYILTHLFQGGPPPEDFCFAVGPKAPDCAIINGDVNGDGARDLSDPIYSLTWSFQGGPDPVMPCPGGPEVCDDGFDNDGNGDTDCEDAACIADPNCIETVCDDLVDNDGDGRSDCADSDCVAVAHCLEAGQCDDNVDNDLDFRTDCLDPDCVATEPILCVESACTDGVDNDGDGKTDCVDPDCPIAEPLCVETACTDGVDNDGDGKTDCVDPDCPIAEPILCVESACDDDVDNDGDGATDCFDVDCFSTEPLCQSTCVEDFDDDVFNCGFAELRNFSGGQRNSVVVSGGVATFVKTGDPEHFTRAIGMAPKIPPPWSAEVTVVDVSDLPEDGGVLIIRFWKPGFYVYDYFTLRHRDGDIVLLGAYGILLESFSAAAIASMTLKFDVAISGLTLSVATDGGAFGAGTSLEWDPQNGVPVDANTPIGMFVMAWDIDIIDNPVPTPGPFSIDVDDMKLTEPVP